MIRVVIRVVMCAALVASSYAWGEEAVAIRFRAMVGGEELACGRKYPGIGTTKSTITPRDCRFYVHNVRLIDEAGKEIPVELKQDGKWQLDNVALLDFEDGSGSCQNGTTETNREVVGTAPGGGRYRGLRFTLGVPVEKNHTDLMSMPSPLNLTALAWVWNAGRKFARLDFSSTGAPRGYIVHLGSTGCTPAQCISPNRPEIELTGFDPAKDEVIADLAALLKDSNVDTATGCMSDPETPACRPILANFGLQPGKPQTFFRSGAKLGGQATIRVSGKPVR